MVCKDSYTYNETFKLCYANTNGYCIYLRTNYIYKKQVFEYNILKVLQTSKINILYI